MSGATAPAPWRIAFDNARDPYTARNALGITTSGGGGGGAPDDAEYITAAPDPDLTSERVLTDTVSVTWDFTVAGVAKANVTPAVTAGYVLKTGDTMTGQLVIDTSAGLAVFTSAAHTTGAVLSSGGVSATGSAANIGLGYNTRGTGVHAFSTGAPGALTTQVQISHQAVAGVLSFQGGAGVNNISMSTGGPVTISSIDLNGVNAAITQAAADNSTKIATTAWVRTHATAGFQPLDSELTAIAGLTSAADTVPYFTGSGSAATSTYTAENPASWTPVLTFATPGDLTVVYATQAGRVIKIGKLVFAWLNLQTSTFTHTTAAGALTVTGLPYTSGSGVSFTGALDFAGITMATYTNFSTELAQSSSSIRVIANGSGVARAFVGVANAPTGSAVVLRGAIVYFTA